MFLIPWTKHESIDNAERRLEKVQRKIRRRHERMLRERAKLEIKQQAEFLERVTKMTETIRIWAPKHMKRQVSETVRDLKVWIRHRFPGAVEVESDNTVEMFLFSFVLGRQTYHLLVSDVASKIMISTWPLSRDRNLEYSITLPDGTVRVTHHLPVATDVDLVLAQSELTVNTVRGHLWYSHQRGEYWYTHLSASSPIIIHSVCSTLLAPLDAIQGEPRTPPRI